MIFYNRDMKNALFILFFAAIGFAGYYSFFKLLEPKNESVKMLIDRYKELHERYDSLKDEAITCEYENAVLVRKLEIMQKKFHQACDCDKDISLDSD